MFGYSYHPIAADPTWGYYYSLSDDLVHWSRRKLLLELPGENAVANSATDTFYAYPSFMDPDSPSMNFQTSDENAYLYVTRFNNGVTLDRDLIRFPVKITPPVYPVPTSWRFDSDGDMEGWVADNQLTSFTVQNGNLSMESTGDDPFMLSAPVTVPADKYNRLGIRMKVSAGGATGGQLFFVTDADSDWDEAKSLIFDVSIDDEYHDYELDMSMVEGWKGVITQLRLDPVWNQGKNIDIDIIAFIE
jgi:hypothetical protein